MKEPPGSAVRLVRWVIFWDSIVPRVPVSEDVEFAPDLPLDHLVRLRSREGRDCEVLRPLAEKSKFPVAMTPRPSQCVREDHFDQGEGSSASNGMHGGSPARSVATCWGRSARLAGGRLSCKAPRRKSSLASGPLSLRECPDHRAVGKPHVHQIRLPTEAAAKA